MDSPTIALPASPPPLRRPPLPFLAAVVPIAAGVVLWLVSGSLYALCFAALGPLMIAASLADGARTRRRERRTNEAELEAGWDRAEQELRRRQAEARELLWHRHPDAVAGLAQPPLRGTGPPGPDTDIVVGRGSVPSGIRSSGGDGERARSFEKRCATLTDAPVRVHLGHGLCLRGPRPVIAAVARALIAQLCLRFGPGQLAIVGEHLTDWGIPALPHTSHTRRGAFRIAVVGEGDVSDDGDAVIRLLPTGADVPEGLATVIDVEDPTQASVRTPEQTIVMAVEGLSRVQLAAVVRERLALLPAVEELPSAVALADLTQHASPDGLPATIGVGERGEASVDIVHDGPHAIVTGMTGTGKSELLVSWVTAIAQQNGPDRVSFVLADFKGGTAFEPLRALRQVAAVITDLDEEGARRGVSSLTAELRRREAVLARAGARDVSEIALPRLVIVVDEFAALLQEHPDLGAVFTDVAARGRALGMHLILGTQRASGVIRDALATNCPLRIGLRVVDAADSRLVIGSSAAAEIPGGPDSRGLGFVRRPQDAQASAIRIARTAAADLRSVAMRWADAPSPHSPWMPALPSRLPLSTIIDVSGSGESLVLGRADDPASQQQPWEILRVGADRGVAVVGAPGSGRTTLLRALAAQRPDAQWVPHDREAAWDLLEAWASGSSRPGPLVLCDDLDHLCSAFPPEHAQRFLQSWEQTIRTSAATSFVLTAARATGAMARVLEALPRRALLRMPTRVEHLTAGGEASGFLRDRPVGRARIGEREVQLAWVDEQPQTEETADPAPRWSPGRGGSGLVTASPAAVAARFRVAHPQCAVVLLGDAVPAGAESWIMVGDVGGWQRHPALLERIRSDGAVLIRVENPSDLRLLAGVRDLPPFALPHAGRAWLLRAERPLQRVQITALIPGPAVEEAGQATASISAAAPAGKLSPDAPRLRRQLRRETPKGVESDTVARADAPDALATAEHGERQGLGERGDIV